MTELRSIKNQKRKRIETSIIKRKKIVLKNISFKDKIKAHLKSCSNYNNNTDGMADYRNLVYFNEEINNIKSVFLFNDNVKSQLPFLKILTQN